MDSNINVFLVLPSDTKKVSHTIESDILDISVVSDMSFMIMHKEYTLLNP